MKAGLAALWVGLACGGWAQTFPEGDVVRLRLVQDSLRVWRVEAHALTPVSRDAAWQTLTDFDHLALFVPNLASSRKVRTHSGVLVEQVAQARFLLLRFKLPVVFRVRSDARSGALSLRAVEGRFRRFDQDWRVVSAAGATCIDCRIVVVPDVALPGWLLRWRVHSIAVDSLRCLLREMHRRCPKPR